MKKYVYVYDGIVVRQSNNEYRYGCVNHLGRVVSCSATEKGAQSVKTRELNFLTRQLEYCKKNKPEWVNSYKGDVENVKKWRIVKLEKLDRRSMKEG